MSDGSMTADGDAEEAPRRKGSKTPVLAGLILMLALGGGAYWAVSTGMILGHGTDPHGEETVTDGAGPLPEIAYVALDPMIVSLGASDSGRHLRMTAQLEVAKAHEAEVRLMTPRVLDVMNSYLRAVDVAQLEDPTALIRLRAQIMRRVQLVTGEGRVRDVLLTEFVIN